jgi:hypothetical protein
MKKLLGDLLLIGGVITASLAAAESRRVSRAAEVGPGLLGEVLHAPARTSYEALDPDLILLQDQELPAGTELAAAHLEWLEEHGFGEVLVLRQKQTREVLPVGPELIGRVLAGPVRLPEEPEAVRPGRRISAGFAARLADASDLERVGVVAEVPGGEGGARRQRLDWDLQDPAANPAGASLEGSTLAQAVELPTELRAMSYVDAEVLARLERSGVQEVAVRVPRRFRWEEWGQRWVFLVGVGVTLGGVLLRRSRPDAAELERELRAVERLAASLSELEGAVERLLARADELDPPGLHAALDPLLTGPVYDLAEGREVLRQAHGPRVYAAVMASFARGERNLNRAWSAAVDGHGPEARASLALALPALREAREALPGARPPAPAGFDRVDPDAPLPPDVPLAGGDDPWPSDEA